MNIVLSPVISPVQQFKPIAPIISLTPTFLDVNPFVSLIPIADRINMDPNTIFYDPYRTYDIAFPNNGYYFSYPDMNTDVKVQRKVLDNVWKKLKNSWILNYLKVFAHIKKSGSEYEIVSHDKNITDDIEGKVDWLLNNFYKKSDLANTIEKFRKRANINWWDVDNDDNIDDLKEYIYNQIRRKIANKLE